MRALSRPPPVPTPRRDAVAPARGHGAPGSRLRDEVQLRLRQVTGPAGIELVAGGRGAAGQAGTARATGSAALPAS
jgi:hypothetical protein